jgi:hypothetical protein
VLRSKKLTRVVLGATVVMCSAGFLGAGAGAAVATPARVVAKPNNAMVNTKIGLTGTGFPARTKLTIEECSSTAWAVAAQNPCDIDNAISPTTDAHGRFTARFKVELCPRKKPGPGPATKETCYIGRPQPRAGGAIALVGAARITVTYP